MTMLKLFLCREKEISAVLHRDEHRAAVSHARRRIPASDHALTHSSHP